MKTPKENPADKEARLRERRLAEIDRSQAAQKLSQRMTTDVRTTYGTGVSLFGLAAQPSVVVPTRRSPSAGGYRRTGNTD